MKPDKVRKVTALLGSGSAALTVIAGVTFLIIYASIASNPASASQPSALAAQEQTPTPGGNPAGGLGGQPGTAPTPVDTSEAAAATQGAPGAVETPGLAPLPTGGVPSDQPAGGGTGTTAPASDGGFPWLIVLAVGLLVLAGLGYAVMRQRSPVEVAEPAHPVRRRSDVRNLASQADRSVGTPTTVMETTTTTTQEAGPAPTVPLEQVTGTAVTEPLAQAVAPGTVTCPNCGTANSDGEKFCHECGENLSGVVAQMAPAAGAGVGAVAPPVDVVEEDTPYLETLDRVDEQLEFVLSRPRIVIGTAAGNDIVIDAGFKGWRTVSPVHAEMRREQDAFVLIDRESEYGTFVNEMRTGENILSDGDLVRLGDVRFIFRVPKV